MEIEKFLLCKGPINRNILAQNIMREKYINHSVKTGETYIMNFQRESLTKSSAELQFAMRFKFSH